MSFDESIGNHQNMVNNLRQKAFGVPNPTRGYQRFIPEYKADSGINPSKTIKHFISNDLIQPLRKDRDLLYPNPPLDFNSRKDRWALNPSLYCPTETYLPKVQQYKTLYFPKRNKKDVDERKDTFLKTDHIAIRVPEISNEKPTPFLDLKSKFNVTTESQSSWGPRKNSRSVSNSSSVSYNIISCQGDNNKRDIITNILDKNLLHKKKADGEYADLTRTFRINYLDKHQNAFNENKNIFRHFNGVFTHLYNSSFRNGNLIMPFRKNKEHSGTNKDTWGYKARRKY